MGRSMQRRAGNSAVQRLIWVQRHALAGPSATEGAVGPDSAETAAPAATGPLLGGAEAASAISYLPARRGRAQAA